MAFLEAGWTGRFWEDKFALVVIGRHCVLVWSTLFAGVAPTLGRDANISQN